MEGFIAHLFSDHTMLVITVTIIDIHIAEEIDILPITEEQEIHTHILPEVVELITQIITDQESHLLTTEVDKDIIIVEE